MVVEASEIGKHPDLIKAAQREMSSSDVLVCGQCHSVFHFIEQFTEHKNENCQKYSNFKDSIESKSKVWAFLLWKSAQSNDSSNPWRVYQTWVKLEEASRESWLIAGRTIQSFVRFGNGDTISMPVKITRTIVDTSAEKKLPAQPQLMQRSQIIKRVVPISKSSPDSKIIRREFHGEVDAEEEINRLKKPEVIRSPVKAGPTILQNKIIQRLATRTMPNGNETDEHEIEKILAKRFNPRRREHEYLIKWEKLNQQENTWEPLSHIEECKDLLDIFESQLAKQKEQRAKQSGSVSAASPSMVTSTPARPARFSKVKAMNQVKQWVSSGTAANSVDDESNSPGKRKLDDSDYDDEETDEEFEYDTDKKRLSKPEQQLKRMKNDNPAIAEMIKAGQMAVKTVSNTGNVRILQTKSTSPSVTITKMNGGSTTVGGMKKIIAKSTPDVIIAKDKQQSGVFKKTITPVGQTMMVVKGKPNEGQVRIIDKSETIQSGIVRVVANSSGGNITPGKTMVSRPVPKLPVAMNPPKPIIRSNVSPGGKPAIQRLTRSPQQTPSPQIRVVQRVAAQKPRQIAPTSIASTGVTQLAGNTTIRRTVRTSPTSNVNTAVTRRIIGGQTSTSGVKIVKKIVKTDDEGLDDPFTELSTNDRSSPERALTLCPLTGKVLGKAEGEKSPASHDSDDNKSKAQMGKIIKQAKHPDTDAESQNSDDIAGQGDQQQIHQFLTNEDGTPIFITGEDGTVYQVAGKNANGETILITQGSDGEQTCVLLSADQDLLGLSTSQTEEAPTDIETNEQLSMDSTTDQQSAVDEASQEGSTEGATQPLTIAVGDSDSQDGQITAEIVQADEPSPGGTRKVVLLLPDGNLMVTELSDEQFQSLNIQQ